MKNLLSSVRRTTLLVRKIEISTKFYKNVFGFSDYSDLTVDLSKVKDFPLRRPHKSSKLRVLKGGDPLIGMVGLMELQDPPSPQPEYNMNHLGVGSVAIVLSSSDCALSAGLIEEYGGELLMAPAIGRNLGDEHGDFVPAKVFMARDPDGYFLEVFELLEV